MLGTISAYEIFLITAGLWFLGKFIRYAFPPLFDEFQVTYGVSTAAVGFAYTGFMALYALLQFPSGAIADRIGSVRVITAGALVAGVGSFWLLFSPPFAALAMAMIVIGAGTGAHKTVSVRLLSNVYPSHLGRALGVFDTIGASGGVVAPLIVAAILSYGVLGWPGFFGVTGLVFIAVAGFFYWRMERDDRVSRDSSPAGGESAISSYRATFRRPRMLAFVALTILMAFAYNGLVAFLPLFLTVEGGVNPALASVIYSILFVASVVQILSGEAADRFGSLRTLTVCMLGATLGIAGIITVTTVSGGELATTAGLVAISAVILVVGLGAHGYRPARDVYVVSAVPDATTGGTLGVIRTLLMGSAAIAPTVVGVIGEVDSLLTAFVVLGIAAALGLAIAIGLLITGRGSH